MITLHHLNYSRSFRVLWLLEELGTPYELVAYQRDANFRAPPTLRAIHPLGKAPVIQDDALTLAESSAILAYIDSRYGNGRFSPPANTPAAAEHDEWLQYVESSAAFPIMMALIGGKMGGLPEGLAAFTQPEVAKALDYIAASVAQHRFLMGDEPMLADIQMSYLLASAQSAGLLGAYPAIAAYYSRMQERPAFAKAVAIGGPMSPVRS